MYRRCLKSAEHIYQTQMMIQKGEGGPIAILTLIIQKRD